MMDGQLSLLDTSVAIQGDAQPRPGHHSDDDENIALAPVWIDPHPTRCDVTAPANDPPRRALTAPTHPSFAVADHDRDTWRMYDGDRLAQIPQSVVLACEIDVPLLVVEGCHLVAQGDFSVSAPFTRAELDRLAANAQARGVEIRTVPNRRIPRAWSEAMALADSYGLPLGMTWDTRDKSYDAIVWHTWLSANPRRLASCRRWPQPATANATVNALRAETMRDANMVRQWRQFPDAPQTREFGRRVVRILLALFRDQERGRGLTDITATLGCPWKPQARTPWNVLASVHVSNAYCVACDPRTGAPRELSARTVRKVCGLYANGYPNQIRADLRHHGRTLGRPTDVDRAFVRLAILINAKAREL